MMKGFEIIAMTFVRWSGYPYDSRRISQVDLQFACFFYLPLQPSIHIPLASSSGQGSDGKLKTPSADPESTELKLRSLQCITVLEIVICSENVIRPGKVEYIMYSSDKFRKCCHCQPEQQHISSYTTCFTIQVDRNKQLFMKNMTEFSFNVCSCDWQITTDYLNSPAVTSTHLAPHAAQNKHLEISPNSIWPTYTSRCSLCISTRWLKSTIFDSSTQTAACQSTADLCRVQTVHLRTFSAQDANKISSFYFSVCI